MEKKDRLNLAFQYLRSCGLAHTQKDIAEKMKATRPNVSAAFLGKEKNLTTNFLKRFNRAYGNIFNLEWLLEEKGEMLVKEKEVITANVQASDHSVANAYGNVNINDASAVLQLLKAKDELIKSKDQIIDMQKAEIERLNSQLKNKS